MTFAELKQQLDTLSPEQLATDVVWCGDERGGKVHKLWIAEEDWIGDVGDCAPRSVVAPEDAVDARLIIPRGTTQLLVD